MVALRGVQKPARCVEIKVIRNSRLWGGGGGGRGGGGVVTTPSAFAAPVPPAAPVALADGVVRERPRMRTGDREVRQVDIVQGSGGGTRPHRLETSLRRAYCQNDPNYRVQLYSYISSKIYTYMHIHTYTHTVHT